MDDVAVFDDSVQEVRDSVKKQQLAKKRSQHGTYHSKIIQEEIIDIIGNTIVKDVKESGCFVLISDKTTLYNRQYLTLGLRYLNKKNMKVQEDSTVFNLNCVLVLPLMEPLICLMGLWGLSFC